MKEHKFQGLGMAFGSVRYRCSECGAERIDYEEVHHYPSWRYVSLDCDEAKIQIELIENESRKN